MICQGQGSAKRWKNDVRSIKCAMRPLQPVEWRFYPLPIPSGCIALTLTTASIEKSHEIIVSTEAYIPHRNHIRIEDAGNRLELVAFSIDPHKSTLNAMENIREQATLIPTELKSVVLIEGSNCTWPYSLLATSITNLVGICGDRIGRTKTCCSTWSLFLRRIRTL